MIWWDSFLIFSVLPFDMAIATKLDNGRMRLLMIVLFYGIMSRKIL